ncbi:hypothetical protein [Bacillus sp. AK128]
MKRLLVVILALLIFVGCSQSSVQRNTELEDSINSFFEDEHNSELAINDLTNFNWDKAIFITPYTPQEDMNKKLGVDFKDPSDIASRDDIYLLVFLYENSVVQYAEIQRQRSDFSVAELTPSNDVLKIIRY